MRAGPSGHSVPPLSFLPLRAFHALEATEPKKPSGPKGIWKPAGLPSQLFAMCPGTQGKHHFSQLKVGMTALPPSTDYMRYYPCLSKSESSAIFILKIK